MNKYLIENQIYEALNDYEAAKKAFKFAAKVEFVKYFGDNSWVYIARFISGKVPFIVSKIYKKEVRK